MDDIQAWKDYIRKEMGYHLIQVIRQNPKDKVYLTEEIEALITAYIYARNPVRDIELLSDTSVVIGFWDKLLPNIETTED